ncbi:peptidase inhibitor family I36 protein [Streptomyces sioyaensis]|uniref:peptidase inhibitor family I36 protein n=2 Tax=Streptomyces sioyaensis TaxID=67364 RepID=UPI0037161844
MAHSRPRTHVRRTALVAGALMALAVSTAPATAQPTVAAAPSDCPHGYFCGYKRANFQGLGFRFKDCYMQEIPSGMGSGGSWYNNQTEGTMAVLYNKAKEPIFVTDGAPSQDAHGSWAPVWYVDAC